jgi:hypothetical protein
MKTIIPAQGGFSVLHFVEDVTDGKHTFSREPIIGWVVELTRPDERFDHDHSTSPITATGVTAGPIEDPNGQVNSWCQHWPSAQEWFRDALTDAEVRK